MGGDHKILLIGIALIAAAVGILVVLGTGAPVGLTSQLLAWGLVAVGAMVVLWLRHAYATASRTGQVLMLLTGDLLLVLLAVALVALAYARAHRRALSIECDQAASWGSAAERAQAYEETIRLRSSAWHGIARRLVDDVDDQCTTADEERERLRQGLCPIFTAIEAPCRCGEQRWPEDSSCPEPPRCRGPREQERLVCPADERPEPIDLEDAKRNLQEVQDFLARHPQTQRR